MKRPFSDGVRIGAGQIAAPAFRRRGINRVVYAVTSKPPGTIEWE